MPWNEAALTEDLGLGPLFETMAQGDPLVHSVARVAILTGVGDDIDAIRYRQDVLYDCLDNPGVVRAMYAIVVAAMERETDTGRSSLARNPDWVLRWASTSIEALLGSLEQLRRVAESSQSDFSSAGVSGLMSSLIRDLDAGYCSSVRDHLQRLKFRDGIEIGVSLGQGNGSSDHVLLDPPIRGPVSWLTGLIERFAGRRHSVDSFTLDPADEVGVKALASLRDQGLSLAAQALGEAADHMRSFLGDLHKELAFYVGCLNLHEQLTRIGAPISMPQPSPPDEPRLAFDGLCDPALALTLDRRIVGNDVQADGMGLILVTGANQGGKSTFLRSVGLAQMLMQAGMFVSAESFSSSIADGLSTHFRREEDAGMESGKFDDELRRMRDIVDHVAPGAVLLLNESFAATNEREGSEVAQQIMSALLDWRVRILCVTHFYELAQSFRDRAGDDVLFLQAEREEDGKRSFKMIEGEPLRTSFGEDLYDEVFRAENPDDGQDAEDESTRSVSEPDDGAAEHAADSSGRASVPQVGRR